MDMTKRELSDTAAAHSALNAGDAKRAIDAVFDAITSVLAGGGEVAIAGFGKFSVSQRAAREGPNPATGEPIAIAASNAAKFSPAATLKNTLNQ